MTSESFDGRLAALQARFRARASDDGARVQTLLTGLEEPRGNSEILEELRRLAHGLAGAGGTFGFPAVSAAAETLETQILDDASNLTAVRARAVTLLTVLQNL